MSALLLAAVIATWLWTIFYLVMSFHAAGCEKLPSQNIPLDFNYTAGWLHHLADRTVYSVLVNPRSVSLEAPGQLVLSAIKQRSKCLGFCCNVHVNALVFVWGAQWMALEAACAYIRSSVFIVYTKVSPAIDRSIACSSKIDDSL